MKRKIFTLVVVLTVIILATIAVGRINQEEKGNLQKITVAEVAHSVFYAPQYVAISEGYSHTVGLRADGTVVATKYTGDSEYYYGECEVDGWSNIVAVSASGCHTIGLKSDGTIVLVGGSSFEDYDVPDCNDIKIPNN